MNQTKNKTSLILACGLALALLPAAFAESHGDKHTPADMFKAMDANGDGRISSAEHVTGGSKMFTGMDGDRDGFVTATEMTAAHAKMKADMAMPGTKPAKPVKSDPTSAEMIKKLDKNNDGKLSAAEHDAGCAAMFTKADKNKDGSLNEAECAEGEKMMKSAD